MNTTMIVVAAGSLRAILEPWIILALQVALAFLARVGLW